MQLKLLFPKMSQLFLTLVEIYLFFPSQGPLSIQGHFKGLHNAQENIFVTGIHHSFHKYSHIFNKIFYKSQIKCRDKVSLKSFKLCLHQKVICTVKLHLSNGLRATP